MITAVGNCLADAGLAMTTAPARIETAQGRR